MEYIQRFYTLIGLTENHTISVPVSKEIFVSVLSSHVGSDSNSSFDIFASNNTHYKGQVGQTGFFLRRKRGFTTFNNHYCKAIGTFREENNQLLIDIVFKNFPPLIAGYLIILAFFGVFAILRIPMAILSFSYSEFSNAVFGLFSVVVFFGITSVIIRHFSLETIRKMKFEMENNFKAYAVSKSY